MNVTNYNCPKCGHIINQADRFCSQCGLEVKMDCPACADGERLWLATINPSTERCANHDIHLYACEKCGRWYLPCVRQCEAPPCRGIVRSPSPSLSGRLPDGRGRTLSFELPVACMDNRSELKAREWDFKGLHATLYAHHRIYVWHKNFMSYQDLLNDASSKRFPLPGNASPAKQIRREDRLCLFGGAVILAGSSEFLAVDLGLNNHIPFYDWEPLAQVANSWWWVAWVVKDEKRVLLLAEVTEQWDCPDLREMETPEDAEIVTGGRIKGRIVINDHSAYWIGKDNGIWRLNLEERIVEQAAEPLEIGERLDIWTDNECLGSLCEIRGQWECILEPSRINPYGKTFTIGEINYDDFLLDEEFLWIIGGRIWQYPLQDHSAASGNANSPLGTWVSGCIAKIAGGKRLLALAKYNNITRVSVMDASTGAARILWETDKIEPKGLFAMNNGLYVYHNDGLIELREAGK